MSNHEKDHLREENKYQQLHLQLDGEEKEEKHKQQQEGEEEEEEKILISSDNNSSGIRNVVVTGFGLFRDHQINPSWEAIKDGQLKINRSNINVITKQVNVSYEDADKAVSTLWKEYNPILLIHVGLAAHENAIRIEQLARHGPYIHDDVVQFAPHKELRHYDNDDDDGDFNKSLEENIIIKNYSCKPCQFGCSKTCLNIDRVCDKMNQLFENNQVVIPTKKSNDAGLYLCEYIYHRSLAICDKAVFVHVPSVENFELHDIRNALKFTTEFLVDEVLNY